MVLPVLLSFRGSPSLPRTALPALKALGLLSQATHLHPNCWTWKRDATAGGLCARGAFLAGRGSSPSPPAITLGFPPQRPQPCCAQRVSPHRATPPSMELSSGASVTRPHPSRSHCQLSSPPAPVTASRDKAEHVAPVRAPQRTTKTCEETPDLPCGPGRPTSGRLGGSASGERSQRCLPAFSRTVCLYRLTCLAEPQANYWLSSQGPQRGNARSKAAPGSNLLTVPASFLE